MAKDPDKPKELGDKYMEWTIEKGEVSVEVHGCTDGKSCRQATGPIERALGNVKERKGKQGLQRTKQRTK